MSQDELFELRRLAFNLALLKRPTYYRVMRWPGALAMVIGLSCSQLPWLADAPTWARLLVGFAAGYAAMAWLAGRAWRRYAHRQWNSLDA